MAVTALVLGIIALLTSFLPIINNVSFLLALLGAVFGIVGVVATVRGTRRGKPLAVSALVLNIVAFAVVLATQAMFSAAIDEATLAERAVGGASAEQPSSEPQSSEPQADYSNLAVGTTAELDNGLSVCVQSVEDRSVELRWVGDHRRDGFVCEQREQRSVVQPVRLEGAGIPRSPEEHRVLFRSDRRFELGVACSGGRWLRATCISRGM